MCLRTVCCCVVVFLAAGLAVGEDAPKEGLRQPAPRVRVKIAEGTDPIGPFGPRSWITGKLLSTDQDSLTIQGDDHREPIRIPKEAASRFQLSNGRRTLEGITIGVCVGAIVGKVWADADERSCEARGDWFCGIARSAFMLVTVPIGGLVGGAVGAGTDRWTDVSPGRFSVGVAPLNGGIRVVGVVRF
jgi:hypothetical protein